jgi:hypothetical protein
MKNFCINSFWLLLLCAFGLLTQAQAAAWSVNNTTDTPVGQACPGFTGCSLREAITSAEANPGPDAILVEAGTYILTNGTLTITQDLTISRVGAGTATISGGGAALIFNVSGAGTDLVLRFLTITNGSGTQGGAIYNPAGSTVSIESCTISSNTATEGGAIYNAGTLTLQRAAGSTTNTVVSNNSTRDGTSGNDGGAGGAIYNTGTLTLTNVTMSGNRTGNGAPPSNSGGIGGGIYSTGPLTLTSSTISSNTLGSGGIPSGSGIYSSNTLSITNSTISGNTGATRGGGIGAFGNSISITGSTISGNTASVAGAGLYIAVAGSNISTVSVTNCTISNNTVTSGSGGGIYHTATGIVGATSTLTLRHSTISGNTAAGGAGIANLADPLGPNAARLNIGNTILANNGANLFNSATATFMSEGYNLSSDGGGGFLTATGDQINTDPLLDPAGLQNNGGPTQTIKLQVGSPALDKGKALGGATTDQRGMTRPVDFAELPNAASGDGSDIGAFEAQRIPTTTTVSSAPNPSTFGQSVTFTATVSPVPSGGTVNFVIDSMTVAAGVAVDGAGQATFTTSTLSVGIHPVAANYSGNATYDASNSAGASHQVGACSAVLSKLRELFTAQGGTGSFTVTIDSPCSWTATSNNPDWITVTAPVGSFTGTGMVSYNVASNPNSTRRGGSITVAGQTFTILQGASFNDVPLDHPFYDFIAKLSALGITVGCGNGNYCPDDNATREQMAIFIERALGVFNPPTPMGQTFQDVPPTMLGYPFIEDFVARGITQGCAAGPPRLYCPLASVTREQVAIFIIRALGVFTPPAGPVIPTFQDVPNSGATDYSYEFIEELYRRGITQGCAAGPPRLYCPTAAVTRGQMAAFLIRAFGQ